ncbi:hypothetical protein [Streptomyces sp. TE33382]
MLRLGVIGPRARKMRSALSALGISLGVTAVIAVTGISASNRPPPASSPRVQEARADSPSPGRIRPL